MKILVIDTEATTFMKGNPFSSKNKLMCIGFFDTYNGYKYYDIEHSGMPYDENLGRVINWLQDTELLIGFNIKYDLHWLRRYIPSGISIPRIWDCQLAQFILNDQTTPYPSLNECLAQYQLPLKLDLVKTEYWDKGIDTTEIPQQILKDYNEQDCYSTYKLYKNKKNYSQETNSDSLNSTVLTYWYYKKWSFGDYSSRLIKAELKEQKYK
jgi:DNA polymerase I-like protein with 3'-5' exonuclease and polymerase domains